jgi:uncharacterized protein YdaU (DUF1376 family)
MAKKIKYVQLEPAEVLLDFHKSRMTAEQFGCYWLIILNLYCEGGKINFDLKELSLLCNCTENFEKVWRKIKNKFRIKNNIISHKRVKNELKEAKRRRQAATDKAVKGANTRWHKHSTSNACSIAKERKGNEMEVKESKVKESKLKESKDNRNEEKKNEVCSGPVDTVFSSALSSITARPASPKTASRGGSNPAPGSLLNQQLSFYNDLKEIIRPASESDLTCFHRLSRWLVKEITFKRFNEHIFGRVLDMARESSTGSRNPAAVFMSRLKKELGYSTG